MASDKTAATDSVSIVLRGPDGKVKKQVTAEEPKR